MQLIIFQVELYLQNFKLFSFQCHNRSPLEVTAIILLYAAFPLKNPLCICINAEVAKLLRCHKHKSPYRSGSLRIYAWNTMIKERIVNFGTGYDNVCISNNNKVGYLSEHTDADVTLIVSFIQLVHSKLTSLIECFICQVFVAYTQSKEASVCFFLNYGVRLQMCRYLLFCVAAFMLENFSWKNDSEIECYSIRNVLSILTIWTAIRCLVWNGSNKLDFQN